MALANQRGTNTYLGRDFCTERIRRNEKEYKGTRQTRRQDEAVLAHTCRVLQFIPFFAPLFVCLSFIFTLSCLTLEVVFLPRFFYQDSIGGMEGRHNLPRQGLYSHETAHPSRMGEEQTREDKSKIMSFLAPQIAILSPARGLARCYFPREPNSVMFWSINKGIFFCVSPTLPSSCP